MAQHSASSLDDLDAKLRKKSSRRAPVPSPRGSSKQSLDSKSSWFSWGKLEFPGTWDDLDRPRQEAIPSPRTPPGGFTIELSRQIDGDLKRTRDWSVSHQFLFDMSPASPQGGMPPQLQMQQAGPPKQGYMFNSAVQNGAFSVNGQYMGGSFMLGTGYSKGRLSGNCSAEIVPPQAMQMGIGDQLRAALRYKGDRYSLSGDIGSDGGSLAYVATMLPGVAAGIKLAGNFTAQEFTNSYFARWRDRTRKNALQVKYSNDMHGPSYNLAFIKTFADTQQVSQRVAAQLNYHPLNDKGSSTASLGYGMTLVTGLQCNAAVDTDFKVTLSATVPSFVPLLAFSVFTEVDHKMHNNKFGVGVHINLPSEEAMAEQEQQAATGGGMPF